MHVDILFYFMAVVGVKMQVRRIKVTLTRVQSSVLVTLTNQHV